MLLASVILKMGFFGLLRFVMMLFYNITFLFLNVLSSLPNIGLLLVSFAVLCIVDYKKIVAN